MWQKKYADSHLILKAKHKFHTAFEKFWPQSMLLEHKQSDVVFYVKYASYLNARVYRKYAPGAYLQTHCSRSIYTKYAPGAVRIPKMLLEHNGPKILLRTSASSMSMILEHLLLEHTFRPKISQKPLYLYALLLYTI